MKNVTAISEAAGRQPRNDEDRARIAAEAFAPGACIDTVASQYNVSKTALYVWRKKFMCQTVPYSIDAIVPSMSDTAILVELVCGDCVIIAASTSPALAAAVLTALQ